MRKKPALLLRVRSMRLSHTQCDNVRESGIKTAPTQIMRNAQRKKQQRQRRRRRQQQRKTTTNRQNIHTINNQVKSGGAKKKSSTFRVYGKRCNKTMLMKMVCVYIVQLIAYANQNQ